MNETEFARVVGEVGDGGSNNNKRPLLIDVKLIASLNGV
jgi:hypothetical protein